MKPIGRGEQGAGKGPDNATAGLTFILTVALAAGAGAWLDRRLGTLPLFALVGLILGLGVGGYWLYLRVGRRSGGDDLPR